MERFGPLMRKYWFLIALIVVILVITGAYLEGFRLGPGVRISRVGLLTVSNLPTGSAVYVDQTIRGTTYKNTSLTLEFMPGAHSVIVSTPGDYPWNMLATITSGKTTAVDPILVPMTPIVTVLTGTDRTAALAAVASSSIPSESKPLHMENGCAAVYVTNNQVIASNVSSAGCTPLPFLCTNGACDPTIVYSPKNPITAIIPYPGHQDALLVGAGNTLYAIALDPRAPQFFAPVLGATNPAFASLPNGNVVIQNAGSIFSVKL